MTKGLGGMDCPRLSDVLLAEDSELPQDECDAISAHIAACPTCRKQYAAADTMLKGTRFVSLPEAQQAIAKKHLIACPTCRTLLEQVTIDECYGLVMQCLSGTRQ